MQKNQLSLPLQYAFVAHDRFSSQLAYALRRVPCCAANASRVTKKKRWQTKILKINFEQLQKK